MPNFQEEYNIINDRQIKLDEKKKIFEGKKHDTLLKINYYTDQI